MLAAGREPQQHTEGVITRMKVKKGRPDRTVIYLDGSSALELATALVDESSLRAGDLLSAEAQDRLTQLDAPYRARSRALRLLTMRDRSKHEVESALRSSGFAPELGVETIAWLEDLGYVDDARYAATYAADRLRAGWGRRRISAELRRRGVDRALVEQALNQEVNHQAAIEGAEVVLNASRRRFASQFTSDARAAERRLAGFLLRRGYDWEIVGQVASALRREAGETAHRVHAGESSTDMLRATEGPIDEPFDAEAGCFPDTQSERHRGSPAEAD